MAELLATLSNAATFAFVVSSMLSVGLGLTFAEITRPLRDPRLVTLALIANFVVVPVTAVLVARLIRLEPDVEIGLVLLGVAAGAPFLPKLAQVAKGDLPFAVALMALLILVSVIMLPVMLPLLSPGIKVDALTIATSLLLTILLPLAAGLFVRWRTPINAHKLVPTLAVVTNFSLVLLLILLLGVNLNKVLAMFGSGAILATVILTLVGTAIGYLFGGPRREIRDVLALGTGQRNLAACFIVANANFADRPHVLALLAAATVIGALIGVPLAVVLGRQSGPTSMFHRVREA